MKRGNRLGVIYLILATVLWSFTGIFVKHFSIHSVERDVQNLFRYTAATLSLWLFIIVFLRDSLAVALRRWRAFLLPAAINCVFQVTMVSGLYTKSIYPGLSSLLSKSSVIFSAALAFIIFKSERATILSWRYLSGCCIGIVGVIGVVMFGERALPDFQWGVSLVILASFLWACYTIAMKRVVGHTKPIISFALVAAYTMIFFLALALIRSDPLQFFAMPIRAQGLMLLSGVVCISIAHTLYFQAVKRLGIAVCGSFLLVQPLITGSISAVFFGEALNRKQLVMGTVLLTGALLIVLAGRRYDSGVGVSSVSSRVPKASADCPKSMT